MHCTYSFSFIFAHILPSTQTILNILSYIRLIIFNFATLKTEHENLVIIPTYNEKENIAPIIQKVFSLKVPFHILVIDDNSPDGTASLVKILQLSFPGKLHMIERSGKLGLGTAYITGFHWALNNHYTYIYEMDADFSHNPEDLVNLYDACKSGDADMAIGSRYISGVNVINWPIGRVIISYFASVYVRFITGMKIMDATAGFKCYKRIVLETINLDKIRFKGYAFQIEMKFTAWKFGFNIVEVPIIFTDRKEGSSKMTGSIVNEAVWGVIKMKILSLFKTYKR
jgi:dolichol-phosphate mannosyltransferase